jgi:hypothetical protein
VQNTSASIPPAFIAGEQIATSSFMFVHEMKLSEVRATFLHERGEHEIVLVGVPRVEGAPQQAMASHWPRLIRFSRVRLEGVVDREDPAGSTGARDWRPSRPAATRWRSRTYRTCGSACSRSRAGGRTSRARSRWDLSRTCSTWVGTIRRRTSSSGRSTTGRPASASIRSRYSRVALSG